VDWIDVPPVEFRERFLVTSTSAFDQCRVIERGDWFISLPAAFGYRSDTHRQFQFTVQFRTAGRSDSMVATELLIRDG
jgi:hypothetical protein